MSKPGERREAVRLLLRLPLALLDDAGAVLDDRAVAHDLSTKGFQAETQAPLKKDQTVGFRLELGAGDELRGRARIAWTRPTDLANWAGAEFVGLKRADVRRLKHALNPSSGVDWDALADRAIIALGASLAVLLLAALLGSSVWRIALFRFLPKAVAVVLMGWSLRELLRPRD